MVADTQTEMSRYAMIGEYGLQMTLMFLIAIAVYTISVLRSRVKMVDWYRSNGIRFAVALVLFWLISAAIVIVPNFSGLVGTLGLNFDQGTAAVGLAIAALVIKGQADVNPSPLPVEVVNRTDGGLQ